MYYSVYSEIGSKEEKNGVMDNPQFFTWPFFCGIWMWGSGDKGVGVGENNLVVGGVWEVREGGG